MKRVVRKRYNNTPGQFATAPTTVNCSKENKSSSEDMVGTNRVVYTTGESKKRSLLEKKNKIKSRAEIKTLFFRFCSVSLCQSDFPFFYFLLLLLLFFSYFFSFSSHQSISLVAISEYI
jgi:hypothetical protein